MSGPRVPSPSLDFVGRLHTTRIHVVRTGTTTLTSSTVSSILRDRSSSTISLHPSGSVLTHLLTKGP